MLLTLKNLQQQTFTMEIDPEITVKVLKERIEKEKGADAYAVASQKLIYAGKIMADDDTINKYNIDEKKFVVVMVTKGKPAAPASTPAAPASESVDKKETSEDKKEEPAEAKKENVVEEKQASSEKETEAKVTEDKKTESKEGSQMDTSTGGESTTASGGTTSSMVVGEEYNAMVQNIVDMGYDKSQVIAALKASFNNPERAIEYLLNGIPTSLEQNESSTPVAFSPSAGESESISRTVSTAEEAILPPASETQSENPLGFLRNSEMFQQMRMLIQRNPGMLNTVLQQMAQSNPELLQTISQNQDAFMRMINEVESSYDQVRSRSESDIQAGLNESSGLPGTLEISQQDKEAIDRLKALGFPEHLVVQAYFACDKNENLAANFLLSQNFDD